MNHHEYSEVLSSSVAAEAALSSALSQNPSPGRLIRPMLVSSKDHLKQYAKGFPIAARTSVTQAIAHVSVTANVTACIDAADEAVVSTHETNAPSP